MNYVDFLPGAKLDIRVLQQVRSDSSNAKIFLTTVLDVTEDDKVIINMPQAKGKMVLLPENIRYELVFTTTNGLFKATGQVADRGKKGGIYILVLKLDSELEKIQRREYFRLEVLVPLIFTVINEEIAQLESNEEIDNALDNINIADQEHGIGTILDISGGGIRFISSEKLAGVEYLLLKFQLGNGDDAQQLEVACRLLNSSYKEDARKYEHRVKFVFKDDIIRETIIRYIFNEERRIRKKSLG